MLETRLAGQRFTRGADYSIADVDSHPWVQEVRVAVTESLGDDFASSPAVTGWLWRVGERPAVTKGTRILEE